MPYILTHIFKLSTIFCRYVIAWTSQRYNPLRRFLWEGLVSEEFYKEFIELLDNVAPGYGYFINILVSKLGKSDLCIALEIFRKLYDDPMLSMLLKIVMKRNARLYDYLSKCLSK
jgi:hypothetical protein